MRFCCREGAARQGLFGNGCPVPSLFTPCYSLMYCCMPGLVLVCLDGTRLGIGAAALFITTTSHASSSQGSCLVLFPLLPLDHRDVGEACADYKLELLYNTKYMSFYFTFTQNAHR